MSSPFIAVLPGRGHCALAALKALNAARAPRVRVVVRDLAKKAETEKAFPAFECVLGDLAAPDSLDKALEGIDAVFLVPPTTENRAELAANGAAACKRAGVKHIVLLSILGAQYESGNVAKEFRSMEKSVESSGAKFTFLRCGAFMENLLSQATSVKDYKCFMGGQGAGRIASVAADDIGRVTAAVLLEGGDKHGGKAYDLTGPESIDNDAVAAKLSSHVGYTVVYRDLEPEAWGKQLSDWSMPAFLCAILVELNKLFRTQAADVVAQDVKTITGQWTSWDDWLAARVSAFGAKTAPRSSASSKTAGEVFWMPKTEKKLWWA